MKQWNDSYCVPVFATRIEEFGEERKRRIESIGSSTFTFSCTNRSNFFLFLRTWLLRNKWSSKWQPYKIWFRTCRFSRLSHKENHNDTFVFLLVKLDSFFDSISPLQNSYLWVPIDLWSFSLYSCAPHRQHLSTTQREFIIWKSVSIDSIRTGHDDISFFYFNLFHYSGHLRNVHPQILSNAKLIVFCEYNLEQMALIDLHETNWRSSLEFISVTVSQKNPLKKVSLNQN